jgi:hypothetical protein
MSLNMLIEFGDAVDYTGADFDGWCKEAGFKRTEVLPLAGPTSAGIAYKWARLWKSYESTRPTFVSCEALRGALPPTLMTASAKAFGASWGRLCPMPPSIVRWE